MVLRFRVGCGALLAAGVRYAIGRAYLQARFSRYALSAATLFYFLSQSSTHNCLLLIKHLKGHKAASFAHSFGLNLDLSFALLLPIK